MGEYMGRSLLHIQRKTNQQIQTARDKMSVSFKVTLSKGEEQETRRFQVDKEVAGSLVYLKQKIAAIFPELRRSDPVLSWVDEDGDEVAVTSDEELQVALTALTGPVYKLKVKLGDKAKDEGNSGMARSAQVHPGVVCDGCDGPVVGPRFKCLVCPDYDLCATCEDRGLHAHHKMIRLPAPCKRVAPRCHLARQVNPLLGDPNIQMLANLFGERPWVNGCQGMRPAMPTTKNQARKAEPMDTKPAEKKPQTEKIAEAKKTECGEPSKPATTTEHRTDQPSADANRLPGIFADLTPLLGPLQAEQLSQFLRNFSAPQQNQEPEKKEAKEKQPEQQLQEQLGQLDQLGQLGQLGSLISTFLGPAAVEAAFPLLEALTKAGQDHLAKAGHDGQEQPKQRDNQATEEQVPAQEKEAEEKDKKDVEPEKEKGMETQDDIKEDSDFEVIPEVSPKPSIYPTPPSEEQTRLWKTNLMQPENEDGKETAEKMDTGAEDMKGNDNEDRVEAALKTMLAMGFSDDGGWLSSLLRAKSGDVGKVLDAIKPSVLDRY